MPYKTVKNLYNFLFILILGIFYLNGLPVLAVENNLFISEINFRGSLSSSRCIQADKLNLYEKNTNWCGKDQWIEIYNPTKEDINLSGWSVEFRGGKTTALEGFSVKAETALVMAFTQQNFASVLPIKDVTSYNLLYLSSESGKQESNHNITAILKKNGETVDQINIHPSVLDSDYLNTRGRSFFKCQKDSIWQKSTELFDGQTENFGTPGFLDTNCPKTKPVERIENPETASPENTLLKENISNIDQVQPVNQINTAPTTNLQIENSPTIKQTTTQEVLPISNTSSIVKQELSTPSISKSIQSIPQAIQTPQIKIETNFSSKTSLLNLSSIQQNNSTLLKSQYQNVFTSSSNEEILFLNLLTLTGLVFSLTKKLLKFNFKTQSLYVSRY